MTVADTRLIMASGAASSTELPKDAFSEGSSAAPWVMRLHFDDFDERSGVLSAQTAASGIVFSGHLRDYTAAIPCFTGNSLVATKTGLTRIAELEAGQQVVTRDNGLQSVLWVGKRSFGWRALGLSPQLRPIRIKAGALGEGLPERDITLSPNHRMLLLNQSDERLVPAMDLLGLSGVSRASQPEVTYYQVLCANHELLLVDGCWSESYRATMAGLVSLEETARDELSRVIPDLGAGQANYTAVRADHSPSF